MQDQWFHWTASSEALRFWSSSPYAPGISIFANCEDANSGTEIDCSQETYVSKVLSGWDVGDSLLIQIHSDYDEYDVGFCLEEETLVPNDICSDAIPIDPILSDSCGVNGYYTVSFSDLGTSRSGILNNCSPYYLDQWYYWVASSDALRFTSFSGSPHITIFQNCLSAEIGDPIDCTSANPILSGWSIGDTLFIQIAVLQDVQEVSFCLLTDTLVENNECIGAIPIYPQENFNGCPGPNITIDFSYGATTNSEIPDNCSSVSMDQWFIWIATADALRYKQFYGSPSITIFQDCQSARLGEEIICISPTFFREYILSGWSEGDTLLMQIHASYNHDKIEFCLLSDTLVENDDCHGALPILPVEGISLCENPEFFIPFQYDASTKSGIPESCTNYLADQWYIWIATSDALRFSKYSGDMGIAVYKSCQEAENGNEIDCIGRSSPLSNLSGWSIGDTLLIQLLSAVSDQFVSFCLETDTLAINNFCHRAEPITATPPDSGCIYPRFLLPISSEATTRSGMDNNCAGNFYDQWAKWIASSEALRFWPNSSTLGIAVYSHCGEDEYPLDCSYFNAGETVLSGWNIGDTVFIQFFSTSISNDLYYCLEEESLAENDFCDGALPLIPTASDTACHSGIFHFSFSDKATTASGVSSECSYDPIDLWYNWIATTDGLRFRQYGGSLTGISIFASCNDANMSIPLSCSDIYTGLTILAGWDVGDTLWIQIYDAEYPSGTVAEFCLQEIDLAVNNNCLGAIPIIPTAIDSGCTIDNYHFSIYPDYEGLTLSDISGNCSENMIDKWYSWTATSNALRFNVTDGISAGMAIYESCLEASLGNLIDCDDVMVNSRALAGWDIGDQLFIQVFVSPGNGMVRFCLEEENLVLNNDCQNPSLLLPSLDTGSCYSSPVYVISFHEEGVIYSEIPYNCNYYKLDRWYIWNATSNALLFSSLSPAYPSISIFSNCNDASIGKLITCAYGGSYDSWLSGWNIGDQLLIQVSVNEYEDRPEAAFCLNLTGDILPVELLDFSAELVAGDVQLVWSTSSEVNNDRFEIEKSPDGVLFHNIASIPGSYYSSSLKSYSYVDKMPFRGINFYRLKQVDYNGSFEYSDIISVFTNQNKIADLLIFPNPLVPERTIYLSYPQLQSINILNIHGQVVYNKEIIKSSGLVKLILNNLHSGFYLVEINNTIRTPIILN